MIKQQFKFYILYNFQFRYSFIKVLNWAHKFNYRYSDISLIICISLHGNIVHSNISFDECSMRHTTFHSFNRRSVQIDLGVDDEQRVVCIDDIVVDTDTIQILFQKTLEEHVFLLKGCFLLFDGHLVQEDLVVSLVETIQQLEFIVGLSWKPLNPLNMNIVLIIFQTNLITLIERKNFLFFSF